ncbi:MAG: class poly(R)-hydroxyalkanoic acid synthase [Verrucomicrobiaceae bacterium]|nr:class poly(R)-hydroxyalkanoic acid synthase [Verrucomicrobiaceae bacterium]
MLDWFSQCARTIENICEFQKSIADDLFDQFEKGPDSQKGTVETATECCRNLYSGVTKNPERIVEQQIDYWQKQLQLCNNLLLKIVGEEVQPLVRPSVGDRRFMDDAWQENALFDFIKQTYLLSSEHMLSIVENLEGVDQRSHKRLKYYARQAVNAFAPTNFALTNPEVLRKTLETKGENLLQGLQLMVEDKKKSAEMFNVCMSEPNAFELGKNIATTPGFVVAQNELMQLIQYVPATPQVNRTPVLVIPSWVNKYYILDLTEKNSYVKWLTEQGHTVFMISWVNPDSSYRNTKLDDYLRLGPLAAAETIEKITGEKQISGVGYCLGGLLLACATAYGDSHNEKRFVSSTYMATTIDFNDPGDIGLMVDERMVESVEKRMSHCGYYDGRLLSVGFNLLRENELFWNYYVLNYLKGERPAAFDLMHWNSDNTNVPESTYRFLLRELYLRNQLAAPTDFTLNGRRINLSDITTPTYALAAEKDHIALWRSCYPATQLQSGDVRFVLAGSGHIAGCINPPRANKYYYYLNPERPQDPEEWLDRAFKVEGSWWNDWGVWQQQYAGDAVPARTIDSNLIIEAAPGSYVRRRLDNYSETQAAA